MAYEGPSTRRLLVTAGIGLLVFLIAPAILREITRGDREHGWQLTLHLIGGMVSVVGVVELVLHAARGVALIRIVPWLIVVLAGLLIVSQHWAVAVSLGGIGVALVVKGMFPHPGKPPRDDWESGAT